MRMIKNLILFKKIVKYLTIYLIWFLKRVNNNFFYFDFFMTKKSFYLQF